MLVNIGSELGLREVGRPLLQKIAKDLRLDAMDVSDDRSVEGWRREGGENWKWRNLRVAQRP
jgi:hypothetical protein